MNCIFDQWVRRYSVTSHANVLQESDKDEMVVILFVTVYEENLYSMACFDNVPLSLSEGHTWNCPTFASVTVV